jgi:hypothetical protein
VTFTLRCETPSSPERLGERHEMTISTSMRDVLCFRGIHAPQDC